MRTVRKSIDRLPHLILALSFLTTGCSTGPIQSLKAKRGDLLTKPAAVQETGQIAKIPFLFGADARRAIPPQTRIVIMDLEGPCSGNVKDALMRRLVENSEYQVLTRDNLRQILRENQMQWGGNFNTLTSNRIGEFLGASMFIVGGVLLCETAFDGETEDLSSVEIVAALQVIDLQTARVVVSSASRGFYEAEDDGYFYSYNGGERSSSSGFGTWLKQNPLFQKLGVMMGQKALRRMDAPYEARELPGLMELLAQQGSGQRLESRSGGEGEMGYWRGSAGCSDGEPVCPLRCPDDPIIDDRIYLRPYIRAAEHLAKDFADRFFTRPSWIDLEMWVNGDERHGEIVHHVKLGRCEEALEEIREFATDEVEAMPRAEVAELMHNYGVALLCANQPEAGIRKLQAAYRLNESPSSLRMVDVGTKMLEWSLEATPDIEPETQIILARDQFFDEPTFDVLTPNEPPNRPVPTTIEPPTESIDEVIVEPEVSGSP